MRPAYLHQLWSWFLDPPPERDASGRLESPALRWTCHHEDLPSAMHQGGHPRVLLCGVFCTLGQASPLRRDLVVGVHAPSAHLSACSTFSMRCSRVPCTPAQISLCSQAFAKRGREEVLVDHLQHARVCSGQQAQGHHEHVRGDVIEADGDEGRDRERDAHHLTSHVLGLPA